MKTKTLTKRILSVILALTTVISTFAITSLNAYAANYSTSYSSYNEPESNDYAYWNGSKVVKGSGTTTNEIKWMQAALNYCISKKGLNATKLDVDGSFGPSTISKMKSVLKSGSSSSSTNSGSLKTSQIQAVLDEYNYKSGKYWTVLSKESYPNYTLCAKSSSGSTYMATDYKAGTVSNGKYYMSYNYGNTWQCMGFANFVMSKVTGYNPKNLTNGWKKLTSVSSLKVGDIVRSSSGHSAIVLTVDSNGNCTFAECWGSQGCVIKIGGGFNGNSSCKTLSSIKSKYGLSYIYRYEA